MAYSKPGVEITQVQQTVSPTLTAPDLGAVVIGPAYVVVPMEGQGSYTYSQTFTGSGQSINVSGLTSLLYPDVNSVYCDLVKTTGATTGRIHIENIAVNPSATYGLTASSTGVGNCSITWNAATQALFPTWSGANIRVHYRAMNLGINGFYTVQAESDIDSIFGAGQGGYYENPLPFSLTLALQNTTTQVYAVPIYVDTLGSTTITGSGTSDQLEHSRARTLLESQEVYGVAPLIGGSYAVQTPVIQSYATWVNTQSSATEKHERIVVVAPNIAWVDANGNSVGNYLSADRAYTSRNLRDQAAAILNRRVFYVLPDIAYYAFSNINVQELRQTKLATVASTGDPAYAKFSSSVTITNPDGTTTFYPALTDITDTVMTVLLNATNAYQFNVLLPLVGTFMTPEVVGMIAGQNPEQGLTNLPMAGPSLLKFSNDFFSESQLNTIAAGGNYIVVNLAGSFVARHQLSTNMNSVQERELSITKSVDYVAKFIRGVLSGFIGRSLITPGFLAVVGAILNGLGQTLIKDGRINGFKVLSVTQDSVNPDTVRVSISVQPKYPVNYIKIDLIF
jgi:hypothetical protein